MCACIVCVDKHGLRTTLMIACSIALQVIVSIAIPFAASEVVFRSFKIMPRAQVNILGTICMCNDMIYEHALAAVSPEAP